MRSIKLAFICLALTLGGCASGIKYKDMSSSIATVQPDQGRVYFLRSGTMLGAALQPEILLDNVHVGKSQPGGFFYVDTNPGPHEASTRTEVENKLTFVLDRGETKYIKTSTSMGLFIGHVTPELISAEDAQKELPDLSYMNEAAAKPAALASGSANSTNSANIQPTATPAPVSAAAPENNVVATSVPASDVSAQTPQVAEPVASASVRQNNVFLPIIPANNTPRPATPITVEKVEFKLGTSSYTVEKMAAEQHCDSDLGAGLLTGNGPLEIYRVNCKNGQVFMATCEMRQCKQTGGY